MKTIAIISEKGGTGKTTSALGLAVTAARSGETVAVIDLDPQANASNWKDRREEANPAVVSAQIGRLTQTLTAARENGATLAILDTPGKNGSLATEAARRADLVFVMTRPHTFDMETLPAVRDILRIAGDPPAFVLYNNLHPAAKQIADEFKSLTLRFCGLRACPVHLCVRSAYSEATAAGKAASETEPDGKAAAALEALYTFAKEIMQNERRNSEKPTARS